MREPVRAYIALGSNMGDRIAMIEEACKEMDSDGTIKILRTSSLWETEAMYVSDQNNFVNGACEVETRLSPIELLDKLQAIENAMGRVKVIDKGPRCIDLDVLLYGEMPYQHERLQIPHPLMLEREFVLRPMSELIPEFNIPLERSVGTVVENLTRLPPSDPPLTTLTPLAPSLPPITALHPARKTLIMTILNLTPDSFSDGGFHTSASLQSTISRLLPHTHILDIGGQSSRPHAPSIPAAAESARVLPAIALARSLHVPAISVDTYRAPVADAALRAGATIVNDISGGLLDPEILNVTARHGATFVITHTRGTPDTMNSLTHYPHGLIPTVASELLERVHAAESAGIRRWRIILDPGIGFAKTGEQNLELLRRLGELRGWPGLEGLPWLVGASRKGFIGKLTGVGEAKERGWGTAGAVAGAVVGGADVVRVHDAREMGECVKVLDAIYRV
ncbi:Dihydropteroate synthase [Eremomyces bilateralis CBS 781.70]|uniref:Folic acid synthesis protein FOL1 n=1 Tax=Eremomyces bilateralis CBS 781.70 TaxID=1392243 RepID=A0A6G1G2A7_9PEZI|nr:Dihydropteroate synthase [Eremomyces bilateralis CBS 781.70]KAF1812060.1 Dihydropteroate synthase [Eremomyces bilateralis CBS 781.70]